MLLWRRKALTNIEMGRLAERAAIRFLKRKGYRILHCNLRVKGGEIDIVAEHGDVLVFVEVKARSSDEFGRPAEAVNERKQKRLTKLALQYIAEHERYCRDCRFDVVEVYMNRYGRIERINLIADAFDARQ
ncbi:MAG: YraN family protein [Armatimonadota bacterium]|nr:YraN family protein [Armatimonadota bacterium]MCX7777978.1 YraN family protein [Armatimonadota bacterium]MDW8026143.1 YraN family protein [Armatimonadota bacterium]